jgi:NAD(P)-dependent dehydrogenase (short-subunit alcohol dehydrogenase family)
MGVTIITGAASGMGEAAVSLMRERRELLLCDLDDVRLEALRSRHALSAKVEMVGMDIASPDFAPRLETALADRSIETLIHCAGVSPSMASAQRILDVNLYATQRLIGLVQIRMAPGSAAVLFASSAAYMIGDRFDKQIENALNAEGISALHAAASSPGMAYSIAKRGVQLLVRRSAAAFGQVQSRINSISPGIIDTPMQSSERGDHSIVQAMVENSALKREGWATEVAQVALFLSSAAASYVTGIDVLVDGGALADRRAGVARPVNVPNPLTQNY